MNEDVYFSFSQNDERKREDNHHYHHHHNHYHPRASATYVRPTGAGPTPVHVQQGLQK